MASAKDGYPHVAALFRDEIAALRRRRSSRPRRARGARSARSWTRAAAAVVRVERLTPTIVEVVVQRARGGAPVRARAVLPPAELRVAVADGRTGQPPADGRSGADRRVGRQGQGLAVDDRARDGRQLAPVRGAAAGRAGGGDGPDRDARPRSRRANRCLLCGGGLGNAVLFSIAQGAARAGLPRPVLRRLQASREDIYKVEEIEAAPTR